MTRLVQSQTWPGEEKLAEAATASHVLWTCSGTFEAERLSASGLSTYADSFFLLKDRLNKIEYHPSSPRDLLLMTVNSEQIGVVPSINCYQYRSKLHWNWSCSIFLSSAWTMSKAVNMQITVEMFPAAPVWPKIARSWKTLKFLQRFVQNKGSYF